VAGGIKVDNGTLNLRLDSDYAVSDGKPTLVRWTSQSLFHLCNATTDINNANLTITGYSSGQVTKQFIIDGAANITYSVSNEDGWTASNSGTNARDPLVLLQAGNATFDYVDLRNNWFCHGTAEGYNFWGDAAAIHMITGSYADPAFGNYGTSTQQVWTGKSNVALIARNTIISNCVSNRYGSAICLECDLIDGKSSSASFEDCRIEYCYNDAICGTSSGPGGAIRGMAKSRCSLSMTRCKIRNNMSQHICGGIWWESAMAPAMQLTNCEIDNNYSFNNGGGLYLVSSKANLTGCKIRGNYSKANGGGLVYTNFGGPATNYLPTNYTPSSASLMLDANTEITGNHADMNGGGMYIDVAPMNLAYGNDSEPASTAWCVFYDGTTQQQYKINIDLNGGTISNNYAGGNGGGVYLQRNTDIYQTNVRLNQGKVENNTAAGYGGACFIQSVVTAINYYTNSTYSGYGSNPFVNNPDAIKMDVSLGSSTASGGLSVVGNQAKAGGAVFVNVSHDMTVTNSVIYTKVYGNSTIGNAAYPNVANTAEGGAIFVNGGEVHLYGGNITNNTAKLNGGGIYPAGSSIIKVGTGSLTVKDNTSNAVPNNIYLPTGKTIDIMSSATFNPVYVGVYTQSDTRPIAVIAGTIAGLATGTKDNVHDDKQLAGTTLSDNLYFGGSPWSPLQQTVNTLPAKVNNVYQIGTVKELTAFLWLVNNIDTHYNFNEYLEEDETTHPDASAKLTADIDMEGHYWMPFADYSGTFDGNGHTITGITMVPTNVSTERGLFGVNASGTIKNVNLRDCYFAGGGSYIGSIVSQMNGGTLYNSVAQCQLLATATTTKAGGLVGHINGGEVHSSVSTCEMTGYTMGGLAGTNAGNIYNSFANPKFNYSGAANAYFVGGLVAENRGTVANCYVRFSRTNTGLANAKFGQVAGDNSNGNINPSYTPETFTSVPATIVHTGSASNSTYKVVDAPYSYNRPNDNKVGDATLTEKLNEWVGRQDANSGYAKWNRTTAGSYGTGGNINDDYPLPKMEGLSCAASPDGLAIEYKKSLDDMITKYNGLSGGGTIWLYGSPKEDDGSDELVSGSNDSDVLLYVDEDASLLQSNNAKGTLTAYTGQTLKTYSETNGNRWHLFSSPLQQSQIGISYTETGSVPFSWASNPCGVQFSADNDNALFPSDMPVAAFDLYCFYEPEYHWINFRRNSDSHWHENANEVQIHYNGNGTGGDGNETYLVPGKGYLVSINQEQLVQNKGTLNNGNVTLQNVTKTDFNAWAGLLGFNLLGNPYQSYLDFEKFINDGTVNNGSNLWEGTSEYNNTYATYDPSQKAYVQYKAETSYGALTASRYIHPHQGFFVRMTKGDADANSTTVTYTNNMRVGELPTGATSPFRSDEIGVAFPLINFLVRDSESNGDVAVLELGRTNEEGALKMRLGECTGRISLGYEGDDYGILFRTEIEDYQPLRFEATEAGTFTLTWNTANADFERLTLIDNIAGTETDMLLRDSYRFEATADQYASRFKVVIGDYKGIDEPEAPEPAEGPAESFAFQMGDQLVVNGEGNLQVVDMLGRVVMTERLTSSQNMVGLPKAAGVYVLRLTDGGGTRTQKMVVGL